MKLSEYIKHLEELMKTEGDLECWYSADDEGNYYQPLNYEPSMMVYVEQDDDLHSGDDYEEILEDYGEDECRKVICIN